MTDQAQTNNINFFSRMWSKIKDSNATLGNLGNELVTSAQEDLFNLKEKLEKLWVFQDQDKKTNALYVSAVLGKIGFTPIVVGVSLMSSLFKLAGGSLCLILSGRWYTLASRIINTLKEVVNQGSKLFYNTVSSIVKNILKICDKVAKSVTGYVTKFFSAVINAFKYYANIFGDFISAFAAAFNRVVKNIIKNTWKVFVNAVNTLIPVTLGVFNAAAIILKGVCLSVAALFIETGAANSMSGVAKSLFILNESLAAGFGALIDGLYASGNLLIKSVKSMFGFDNTNEGEVIVESDDEFENEFENDLEFNRARTQREAYNNTYFNRHARNGMHYINECVASVGNNIVHAYQKQKNNMYNEVSEWSCSENDHFANKGYNQTFEI